LGQIIKESEGSPFYNRVEHYRQSLKKMRRSTSDSKIQHLLKSVESETSVNQRKLAHAFALQLELVNVCEAAYRTWRQRQKPVSQGLKKRVDLRFVLTAHPTEARSPAVVEILQKISQLLIDGIHNNFVFSEQELLSQTRLLWHLALPKSKVPTVHDEAEFLFSLIFSESIFDFIVSDKPNYDLKLRTWVGGDKDGHPGVDASVMKDCLNLSRTRLINIIQKKVTLVIEDVERLEVLEKNKPVDLKNLKQLRRDLDSLKTISTGDGNRIKKWSMQLNNFLRHPHPLIKKHYQIALIQKTLNLFPALVLPIELREDAGVIASALENKNTPIRKMLTELGKIAGPLSLNSYARGLVISHCEEASDIENACKLTWIANKSKALPIIPLFESKNALKNAKRILKTWLKNKPNLEQVKRHWLDQFEVMLGYSDSAKEIGVLPSRLLIQKSMYDIDQICRQYHIKPTFFHGSGGSVERGGGSLKEQVSWWPDSAIERPKLTLQGEMIQRVFATKEILNSQCSHISNEAIRRRALKLKFTPSPALVTFASYVEDEYKDLIGESAKLNSLLDASPYRYLNKLQIGSRPAKRHPKELSVSSLRAIPWVLCWTQTRALIPSWWGIGTAWKKLSQDEKEKLMIEFKNNPFFSSFIKSLGFTLAKVELSVWKIYFDQSNKSRELLKTIGAEYKATIECLNAISGETKLIWHRPWLEESIHLRAPHIHILNVLQVLAMRRNDEKLLRETLVGIACGMLTTG
jgi:phosphoenolpyruvate carboxylase